MSEEINLKSLSDEELERMWQGCTNSIEMYLKIYYNTSNKEIRVKAHNKQLEQQRVEEEITRRAK